MPEATIATLTPTVCGLFGVTPPALASEPMLAAIRARSEEALAGKAVERCLIYCPDALGDEVWRRFPEEAAAIAAYCPDRVRLSSLFPSITPVCYASAFTGATPAKHGIRRSERPVLACDTLFDALLRAGKAVAIVAVRDSSIDRLFRKRAMDYFSEEYDAAVTARTLELVKADRHDLVVVYHQEYDDRLHETQPFSAASVQALMNHVASAQRLCAAAKTAWAGKRHTLIVAPDHGAHLDQASGGGDHGLDIPEDMLVSHWYGVYAAR